MNENVVVKPSPLVLDVGRRKRKVIRELKQGTGPLAEEVRDAAHAIAAQHGGDAKEVVPVVILYRRRSRKRRALLNDVLRI